MIFIILILSSVVYSEEKDYVKSLSVLNFEIGAPGIDFMSFSIGADDAERKIFIINRSNIVFVINYECDETYDKNFTLNLFFIDNQGKVLEEYPSNSTIVQCNESSKILRLSLDMKKAKNRIGTVRLKATVPETEDYVKFVNFNHYFYYFDPDLFSGDIIISKYNVLGKDGMIPFKVNFLGTAKLLDMNDTLFGDNQRTFVFANVDDISKVSFQFDGNFSFKDIPDGYYKLKAVFIPLFSNKSIEKEIEVSIDTTPPNLTSLEMSDETTFINFYNLTPFLSQDIFGSKDHPLERYYNFITIRGESSELLKKVTYKVMILDENNEDVNNILKFLEKISTKAFIFNLNDNWSEIEGSVELEASEKSDIVFSVPNLIKTLLEGFGIFKQECKIEHEKKFSCTFGMYDSVSNNNKPNLVLLTFCDYNDNCKMKLFYFNVHVNDDWKIDLVQQQPNILPYDVLLYGADGTIMVTLSTDLPYTQIKSFRARFSVEEDEMKKYMQFLENINLEIPSINANTPGLYNPKTKQVSLLIRYKIGVKNPDAIDFTKLPDNILVYLKIKITGIVEEIGEKVSDIAVPIAFRIESPLVSAKFLNPETLNGYIKNLNTSIKVLNDSLKWLTDVSKFAHIACMGLFFSSLLVPGNEGFGNFLYQSMIATCERFVCTPVPDSCKNLNIKDMGTSGISAEFIKEDSQGYRTKVNLFLNCLEAKKAFKDISCDETSSDPVLVEEYFKKDKSGLYEIVQKKVLILPEEHKISNMDLMCKDSFKLKATFLLNYIVNFVTLCQYNNGNTSKIDRNKIYTEIINNNVEYKKLTFKESEFNKFINSNFVCEKNVSLSQCVAFMETNDPNIEPIAYNATSDFCKSLLSNSSFDYAEFTLGECDKGATCNVSLADGILAASSDRIKVCKKPEILNDKKKIFNSFVRQDPEYHGKGECYNTEYPDYHQYRCLLNIANPQEPTYIGDPGENFLSSMICGCFPTARGYMDALIKNLELIKECLESVKRGRYAAGHCELIAGIYACDFFMDLGISIYEWWKRKNPDKTVELTLEDKDKTEAQKKETKNLLDCTKEENKNDYRCKKYGDFTIKAGNTASNYHVTNIVTVATGNQDREYAIKQRYAQTLTQFLTPNVKHQFCVFSVTGILTGVWDFSLLFDIYGKEYEKTAIRRNPQAWLPAGYWTIISYDPIKRMPLVRYNLAVQVVGGTKPASYELYLVCDPDVQDPPAEWCGGERLEVLVRKGYISSMKTLAKTEVIDNTELLSNSLRSDDLRIEKFLFNKVKMVMKYYDVNKEADATWSSEIVLDKKTAIEICDIDLDRNAAGKYMGVICKNPYYEYDQGMEIPRGARTAFITRHKILSVPKVGNPNDAELRLGDSLIIGFEFEADSTLEKLEDSFLFVNIKGADGKIITNFTYKIYGINMKKFFKWTDEESIIIPLKLYDFNLSKETLNEIELYSAEAEYEIRSQIISSWNKLKIPKILTSKGGNLDPPCKDVKDIVDDQLKRCVDVFFNDTICPYNETIFGFECRNNEPKIPKKIKIKIKKSCNFPEYQLKEGDLISFCLINPEGKDETNVGYTHIPVKRISLDLILNHPIIEYAQYYDVNRNNKFDQADFSSPVTYLDFEKGEREVKGSINVKLVPEYVDFQKNPGLVDVYKPTVLFPSSDKKLANDSFEILLVIPYSNTTIQVDGLSLSTDPITSPGIYYILFNNLTLINLGQFKLNITYKMNNINFSPIQKNIKFDPYAMQKDIINNRTSIMKILLNQETPSKSSNSLNIEQIVQK